MKDCKPISTLMDLNMKLSAHNDPKLVDASLYRKLAGSLIWLLNTKLDVCIPAGLLVGFMIQLGKTHWHAGVCIPDYASSMLFGEDENDDLVLRGWTDSDWVGDIDSRSTTGYCFILGSGAISWSYKKQPTIALSFMEAEYRAACSGTCEAIWL
eukprot:c33920_g1_i1 orf=1-459(-)